MSRPAARKAAETPSRHAVPHPEDACHQAVVDGRLDEQPLVDREEPVADAGGQERRHGDREPGRDPARDEPRAHEREAAEEASFEHGRIPAPRAGQRPAHEAEPVDRGERPEAGLAGAELVGGVRQLGDVEQPANRSIAPDATITTRIPAMPAIAARPSRASRRRPGRAVDSSSSRGAAPKRSRLSRGRTARTSRRWRTEDHLGATEQEHQRASAGPAMKPKSAIAPNSAVAAGRRPASPGWGRRPATG